MHLIGTYLYLKRLSARAYECRVKRLVHVLLRHGNIVLETARYRLILLMYDTKHCVAVRYGIHQNSDGKEVIYLVYSLVLIDHLLIYTEEMLCPAVYLCLDAGIRNILLDIVYQALDVGVALCLSECYLLYQIVICIRIEVLHTKVLELYLYLADTKSLRDRAVDILCFSGDTLLCLLGLVLECTHIVQSVCQLYEDDPDILCHGEKHLAQILSLHLKPVRILVLRILGAVCQMQVL